MQKEQTAAAVEEAEGGQQKEAGGRKEAERAEKQKAKKARRRQAKAAGNPAELGTGACNCTYPQICFHQHLTKVP